MAVECLRLSLIEWRLKIQRWRRGQGRPCDLVLTSRDQLWVWWCDCVVVEARSKGFLGSIIAMSGSQADGHPPLTRRISKTL